MCENIDWNVGRLMAKAEELGILEDTIFVYSMDNGPNGVRWNGWQGTIAGEQRIPHIACAIDLFPTLADVAMSDLRLNCIVKINGCGLSSPKRSTHQSKIRMIVFVEWNLMMKRSSH
jgi:hypothetical protein